MSNGPEQGWYPNPENPAEVRWWDGKAWTAHTERNPMAPAAAPAPGMPPAPSAGDAAPQHEGAQQGQSHETVSEWMGGTFSALGAQIRPLAMLSLILGLIPSIAASIVMWNSFEGMELWLSADATDIEFTGGDSGRLVLAGVVLITTQLLSLALWAAFSRQVYLAKQGRTERWQETLMPALRRVPRLFGATILVMMLMFVLMFVTVLVMALSAVVPLLLIVTMPLSVVGFIYVSVRLSLFVVSASLAPTGVSSLRNSFDLTAGRSSMVLGRVAIVLGLGMVASMILAVATQSFGAGEPVQYVEGEAFTATFEMIYGTNQAAFVATSAIAGVANLVVAGSMLAGMVTLYLNLGGSVCEKIQAD